MVYNAMKLFMEINPQLFDDCSHEYTEQQNGAPAREATRERKWAALTEQAERRRAENGGEATRAQGDALPRVDEVDPAEDNQKRLDSLKLQDGDHRRPAHDRQKFSRILSQSAMRKRLALLPDHILLPPVMMTWYGLPGYSWAGWWAGGRLTTNRLKARRVISSWFVLPDVDSPHGTLLGLTT